LNSEDKITDDMLLKDVIEQYPRTLELFQKHGMPHRENFPIASIKFFAGMHSVDLTTLLQELNNVIL
jgi:hypothetical protein